MAKEKKKSPDLEEKIKTTHISAISLDQGHYGLASCGHCGSEVPEPYYEQKKCAKCNYNFIEIKKTPYPYSGSDF
ncbi:hypothetical protein JXB28_03655 [Candidatus Woesearchaeota archaeon]|nr:hypothetical protein [Candidatus Woesearchaeota archaeon]